MPYKVTYTTNTRPTDLPDGATIEEVSALPLIFEDSAHGRSIIVERSVECQGGVYILARGVSLTPDETRRVRDALTEALGETSAPVWDGHSEPPANVTETRDHDGDKWYRLANGNWSTAPDSERGVPWVGNNICHDYPGDFGPHIVAETW